MLQPLMAIPGEAQTAAPPSDQRQARVHGVEVGLFTILAGQQERPCPRLAQAFGVSTLFLSGWVSVRAHGLDAPAAWAVSGNHRWTRLQIRDPHHNRQPVVSSAAWSDNG